MQNSTTSIHHLPAEILSEVFLCLLSSISRHPDIKNPMVALDRVVSLVCKSWRTIAHDEPRLWVEIVAPDRIPDALALVHRYLPRSGSLPLHLVSRTSPDVLLPFISALSPYASRWRSCHMRGTCASFSEMTPVATPLLSGARVHVDLPEGEGEQRLSLHVLADAPWLSQLTIICVNKGPFAISLPLLANLTLLELGVNTHSLSDLFESLRSCHRTLRELRLGIKEFHKLTLEGHGSWPVLQLITPPALRLKALIIRTPIDHGILLQCLARTPNLVSLSLGISPASRLLLRGLTIRDSNDPGMLVPRLQLMACDCAGDLDALNEFFEGRLWPRVLRNGTRIEMRIMLPQKVMDSLLLIGNQYAPVDNPWVMEVRRQRRAMQGRA
ncbi:uncharacterized protein SCHCODRAFT_02683615 [Schizophyllum commune H4-8]|uniref:uncharacterized protein n=1 Tax=Schizophyllum commune (strain H4-8 / FGSC 9210) TaxID=578458 RepID=UPI00215EA08A|nr:uncharacterized protein SCHCODRAFT_02683615 [Schizophyllum commune H4-8]KAI5900810.1 hypothetical protein SCHCODRAFT_02683615 [Schizophyllum commune H4-8]